MNDRTGERWSQEETDSIISLFKSGHTIKAIASIHKRSIGDISIKLKTQGPFTHAGIISLEDIGNMKIK